MEVDGELNSTDTFWVLKPPGNKGNKNHIGVILFSAAGERVQSQVGGALCHCFPAGTLRSRGKLSGRLVLSIWACSPGVKVDSLLFCLFEHGIFHIGYYSNIKPKLC